MLITVPVNGIVLRRLHLLHDTSPWSFFFLFPFTIFDDPRHAATIPDDEHRRCLPPVLIFDGTSTCAECVGGLFDTFFIFLFFFFWFLFFSFLSAPRAAKVFLREVSRRFVAPGDPRPWYGSRLREFAYNGEPG